MSKKTSWEVKQLPNGDFRAVKNKNRTEILFVLDRSSSMGHISQAAVDGFNAFLEEQQSDPKGKRLTLVQFDSNIEFIYKSRKLKDCRPLINGETYVIQGMTALLDAIGEGLHHIKNAKKAIVAVYTDGGENMSVEYSSEGIKKMLKKATKKGWETIFLASELGTVQYATRVLGFAANKVAHVMPKDFVNNMRTYSSYTTNYVNSGEASCDSFQADIDQDVEEDKATA